MALRIFGIKTFGKELKKGAWIRLMPKAYERRSWYDQGRDFLGVAFVEMSNHIEQDFRGSLMVC